MIRFIALAGALLGIRAFFFACTALSARNWEIDFPTASKSQHLYLARLMSICSLIFTAIGILTASIMTVKDFRKYWNLLSAGAYFLASLTLLLAMCAASRLAHHTGWPSSIYSLAFSFLLLATQLMSALAGKIIFSSHIY